MYRWNPNRLKPYTIIVELLNNNTDTSSHTNTHTHRYIDTQTHGHTDTQTYTPTHTHTHTLTHQRAHTHLHTHTQLHTDLLWVNPVTTTLSSQPHVLSLWKCCDKSRSRENFWNIFIVQQYLWIFTCQHFVVWE